MNNSCFHEGTVECIHPLLVDPHVAHLDAFLVGSRSDPMEALPMMVKDIDELALKGFIAAVNVENKAANAIFDLI